MISKMFGDIWPNVAVVINFWDAGVSSMQKRARQNVTEDTYRKDIQEAFKYLFLTSAQVSICAFQVTNWRFES